MKVGDLVRAPYLSDHDGSVGLVVDSTNEGFKVLFASGLRSVFTHLLELVSENR